MTWLLFLLLGAALGVGAEQVLHHLRPNAADRSDLSPLARRRRRGHRLRIGLAVALLLLAVLPLAGYLYANNQFQKVPRVAVGSHLSGGGHGTNYLLVGTDGRPGVAGNRSDTIMLLHIDGNGSKTMSIPRDLWVTLANNGSKAKINAAHNDGPAVLVDTVEQNLNLPINRYLEVSYTSFAGLVDAVGGVTINFPYPASDVKSGLYVPQTGDVKLNGDQALAYVRSRTYTEVIPGRGSVVDGSADLGRVKRQQAFLRAVLKEAGKSKNPFTLLKIVQAMTKGLAIDDHMSLWNAVVFAWDMGKLHPQSVTLPTRPDTAAGQSILRLQDAPAAPILDQFR